MLGLNGWLRVSSRRTLPLNLLYRWMSTLGAAFDLYQIPKHSALYHRSSTIAEVQCRCIDANKKSSGSMMILPFRPLDSSE